MSPENERMYLHDILDRKHKLDSDIQVKSELVAMLKRRECRMTDEEREEFTGAHKDLLELQAKLKEVEADLSRFNYN